MKKKKTNIKIKKSKINIYSNRKAKQKQTISLVITIVAACILAVVGYGVGKPIYNYFSGKNNPPITGDTSDTSSNSTGSSSGSSGSSEPDTSTPVEVEKKSGSYILPIEAVASAETLGSALDEAKKMGFTSVAVTLKDDSGILRYKSEIPQIKNIANINAGELTAAEICDIIKKAGLNPVARVSTLKDYSTPTVLGSYTFESGTRWLDDTAENGGKLWLSPFEQDTVDYFSALADELSGAGFKDIIYYNFMFPPFHGMDKDTWLKHLDLRNQEKRSAALWNIVDKSDESAKKNGCKLWIEITGENLLSEVKGYLDSELAIETEKLKSVSVLVTFKAEGGNAYSDAKSFIEKAKAETNGAELAVLLTGDASAQAQKAFEEAGLAVSLVK